MTKRRIESRPHRGERLESRRCLAPVAFEPHIIDGTEFDQPESIATGDFDSDGDLDLFISARNQDGWYENTGNGDYGNYQRITHDEGARYSGGQVVVEDLDDDGDADVLVKRAYYSTYYL